MLRAMAPTLETWRARRRSSSCAAATPRRRSRRSRPTRRAPAPDAARIEPWVLAALACDALADHDAAARRSSGRSTLAEPAACAARSCHGRAIAPLLRRQSAAGTSHRALVDELLAELDAPARAAAAAVLARRALEREAAVLRFLPTMMSNQEIAGELFVSVNTVKTHLKAIYRKLDVDDRRERRAPRARAGAARPPVIERTLPLGRQLADLDQLEPERADEVDHAVERRLVGDRAVELGLHRLDVGLQPLEAGEQRRVTRPRTRISYWSIAARSRLAG